MSHLFEYVYYVYCYESIMYKIHLKCKYSIILIDSFGISSAASP